MFDLNFIDKLCPSVPKHQRDKFIKHVFIIGLDKLYKKGFMKRLDLQKIKQYKDKVKQKGRISKSQKVEDQSSIKKEIQNLKNEINNLAKNLEKKPEAIKSELRSTSTKKIHAQENIQIKKEQETRKRASSVDKKVSVHYDHQKQHNEVTPKVTETIPQQIFQNFNINISKHHLDDTEIKEVFHNQCLLQMNSANKRKESRQQVTKTYNNPNISLSIKPPKGRDSVESHDPLNNHKMQAQRIKEKYEQDLKSRSSVSMKSEKPKTTQILHKSTNSNSRLKQKCQYDPNAHVSDLPYNQIQPQSKIKEYVDEARRNYKKNQDQNTPQEQSDVYESGRQQNDSVLNTANFTNKNLVIEFVKPKYYDQPQRFEELYKSTVTTLINEDNSQHHAYHQASRSQDQDSQSGYIYDNSISHQSDQIQLDPQIHSNSFSQQISKRSQAEEMTFINSPLTEDLVKNKERGSKSVQQIQQPQFNQQQKQANKEAKPKTQTSYGLSSQKMSLEFSAQKQSQYWDKGQNRNNLYPKMIDGDDYNRSSGSSNFSVFNPNEDLKNFFQNDFLEKKKQNQNNSNHQDSRPSMSSSHISESLINKKQSNIYDNERWFKKKNPQEINTSQDEIVKSNVFQNNRLSVTRILNNSQF